MMPRLFAVDMDGTLLTDTKTFDAELLDSVLTRIQETQGYFVVATGNQYPKSLEYMADFRERGIYFIAENGAYIADGKQDLRISGFSEKTSAEVLTVLEDFPEVGVVISSHRGAFIPMERAETISRIVQEHLDYLGADIPRDIDYLSFINYFYPGATAISDFKELEGNKVVKFALQTHRAQTADIEARLLERLPEAVVPVQSGFGSIDLMPRGINKGTALAWLCKELGVEAKEVMAFGDASNDLEMLNFAGTGVAMGNAISAVKSAADVVIGQNKDGAVLTYIAQTIKK